MSLEQVEAQYQPQVKDEEGNMVNDGPKVKIFGSYDFGSDHDDTVSIFGSESVYHHAKSSIRVGFQQFLRSAAGQGWDQDKIDEEAKNWTPPSGRPRGKTRVEKATELLDKMSPEERSNMLAALEAQQG